MTFKTGDRILSPSGRSGTVQPPPWPFPGHHLIQFDTGEIYWIRTELLSALSIDWTPPRRTKHRSKAA